VSTAGVEQPDRVQSVDRAVTVLQFLAANGWSGVTDVGDALNVHKSTAYRLLTTLEARGLVERHTEDGKYRLGFGVLHLANAVQVGPDLTRQAQPGCAWLARMSDESVTLSVLDGLESVTIDQIIATSTVTTRSWLGRRTPLHCTSGGKVFLASLPPPRRAAVIAGPHHRYTARTVTDPDVLREEIEAVQANGYATTSGEFEEGLSSAAVAIRGADGHVVAAVGVSGPSYRLDARMAEVVPLVLEAAARASAGSVQPSPG